MTLAFMASWKAFRSKEPCSAHSSGGDNGLQGVRNEKWPAPGTEWNSTLDPSASRTSPVFVA